MTVSSYKWTGRINFYFSYYLDIMKKLLVAAILIILSPLFIISCVSTLLQEKAPTFSSEVHFIAPPVPFIRMNKSIFPSWKNKNTGNILTILSDCQAGNTASLSELQRLIEDSVENPNRLTESYIAFQEKPALQRLIRAEVDGSPLEIKSIAFKRISCGYVVSLSGKPEKINLDRASLESFLTSLTFK